jgi:citrate lyase subunit beta/citryl-CoA lyase
MNPTKNTLIRLERSMLFVPALPYAMIEKAAASDADAVCVDLEDSVAIDEKAAGRANAIRAFQELDFGRRTTILRINDLEGPFAYRDLVETVEGAGERIDLIMIPKVNSREDVVFVDMLLKQIEAHCLLARGIGLEAQIETAAGFLSVREIAQSSARLEALTFGPGDYAASMQMPSMSIGELDRYDEMYPGHRWHAVMHAIVASARANGLRCMDGPYAAHKDPAGLERSCQIARAMGFDGKQCIHPKQAALANGVFSPTGEEVAHAKQIVDAYEQAVGRNRGVASLNGKMIDAASVRMAKGVLERHGLINGKNR